MSRMVAAALTTIFAYPSVAADSLDGDLLPTAISRPFLVHSRASRVILIGFAYEINVAVPRYPKRKLRNSTGIRYGEVAKVDNVHAD